MRRGWGVAQLAQSVLGTGREEPGREKSRDQQLGCGEAGDALGGPSFLYL